MENYKIIISSGKGYSEIVLDNKAGKFSIGSSKECDCVIRDVADFEVNLEFRDENWEVECSDGTYFLFNGITKMVSKQLNHGDDLLFKCEGTSEELFSLSFMLNFIYYDKKYDYKIDIQNTDRITLGRDSRFAIYLKEELLGTDYLEIIHNGGTYTLKDNNSKYGVYLNGKRITKQVDLHDYDFFFVLNYAFYFKEGCLYTDLSDQEQIAVNGLKIDQIFEQKSTLEYPKFNRNTRVKTVLDEEPIPILLPDTPREKPRRNLLVTLLPTVGMMAVSMLMRGLMMNGGKYIVYLGIAMVGMGVITSVVTFVNEKKEYKRSVIEREEKYTEYIKNKRVEIRKKREEELEALNAMYYSLDQEIRMVEDFSADLFNRDEKDEDYLDVRLGTGFVEAKAKIDYKPQETLDTKDELAMIPQQVADEYKYIAQAPIVVKLAELNALGVVGDVSDRLEILRTMVVDIVVRQHYSNTKLFFMFPDEYKDQFNWVRFLPHVDNEKLKARNIVCDDESKTLIFDYLYNLISFRENSEEKQPTLVIIIFDSVGLRKHPLSNYIEKAKDLGVVFIFFEQLEEMLPKGCDNIVRLNNGEKRGMLLQSDDSSISSEFVYDTIDPITVEKLVMKLAPVYAEEISLDNTLTKNITLFELLKINNPHKIPIAENWQRFNVVESMAAPLGVNAKDEIVALDIHEKYHGPHGLVAGTTGSGKSEILQSYMLSLALRYHPYEVSFVIIDFKGGGMANQFAELPHLIGAITNIDDREITRSLLSIKAELKKRQRCFAQAEVNHIDAYIRKYKNGEVRIPLPHLIVIVDEFAELKADQPDFMKELISAARIGRSLGVHLILATQKPSGVVDDQIWSNSKFKLCLKVQNKQDSNDVIKSPLAAEIREPGRAYFQVGNNEIFELFQSAYSGAPEVTADTEKKAFEVSMLSLSGKRNIIYQQKEDKTKARSLTQLERIVDNLNEYCEKIKLAKLPPICLPPLEEHIVIDFDHKTDSASKIPIGIYDDPDNQYQGVYDLDLSDGNVWILGSSQMGKTSMLQSIISYMAANNSPSQLQFYILDFASGVLKQFDKLNHVSTVILPNEDEKMKGFYRTIAGEMERRKEILSSKGVSSFTSYLDGGYTDLRRIVVIIDNISVLKELYEGEDEMLLKLVREGSSLGITVISANAQTTGFGYKYLASFASRIALTCTEDTEYTYLFSSTRMRPKGVPGRCLVKIDRTLFECQAFLAFEGEREIDRAEKIREFIDKCNDKYRDDAAPRMVQMPNVYLYSMLKEYNRTNLSNSSVVNVGLNFSDVSPFCLDLKRLGIFSMSGNKRNGKTNVSKVILEELANKQRQDVADVYIIDFYKKDLSPYADMEFVKGYSCDSLDAVTYMKAIDAVLSERYDALRKGEFDPEADAPAQIVILNNPDAITDIANDSEALEVFKKLQSRYRDCGAGLIIDSFPNEVISFGANDILRYVKDNLNTLMFDDIDDIKINIMPAGTKRRFPKSLVPGECYYLKGNDIQKMKILFAPERKQAPKTTES